MQVRQWDALAREYRTVTVTDTAERRPRAGTVRRERKPGRPVSYDGLSHGSPFGESLTDTAYAPGEPLADMRRHVKRPAMRTHRAAVVTPCAPGSVTETDTRRNPWYDLAQ